MLSSLLRPSVIINPHPPFTDQCSPAFLHAEPLPLPLQGCYYTSSQGDGQPVMENLPL